MIEEIQNIQKLLRNFTNTNSLITQNMKSFAYKQADIKARNPVLNYWESDTQIKTALINALNKDGAKYEIITTPKDVYISVCDKNSKEPIFKFRETGKSISKYWEEGVSKSAAEQTNYQEVGVLVWVSILKNGKENLSDFDKKTKIFTDSNDTVEKTLKFLEAESLKLNGWNEQCKKAARAIISNIPQIKTQNYEYHQGGDLFNSLRKRGQSLSGIPGAADKWNPSDIYFIKSKFDLSKYKTIEDLNSCLGEFKDVIGVSLKGADAMHGATSLKNIFKFLKLKEPSFTKWNIKDGKLSPKQISEYKQLLKQVQSASKHCPFENGVMLYIGNGQKYELTKNIDEMISRLQGTIESANWGQSIPVTLSFLKELKTPELWERFAFYGYSLAVSQLDVSAPYYKAEGTGTCKLIQNDGLDVDKFKCVVCRIPLNKDTNIIFDSYYNGIPQKMQFRSKGSLPQMIILNTQEQIKKQFNISQFKFS